MVKGRPNLITESLNYRIDVPYTGMRSLPVEVPVYTQLGCCYCY